MEVGGRLLEALDEARGEQAVLAEDLEAEHEGAGEDLFRGGRKVGFSSASTRRWLSVSSLSTPANSLSLSLSTHIHTHSLSFFNELKKRFEEKMENSPQQE